MDTSPKPDLVVLGWRREDGERLPKGWYCCICPTDDNSVTIDDWLQDWFKEHMTGKYDCHHRFNGGAPLHTVYIRNKKDAIFFALTFLNV